MKLNRLNSEINRDNRNKLNENMAIIESDFYNINIDMKEYKETVEENSRLVNQANSTASKAVILANAIQNELDSIVVEGDSSVEAAQARTNSNTGETYINLRARLDEENETITQQLAQKTEVNAVVINATDFGLEIGLETDQSQALQSAIDYANNHNVKNIQLPNGRFKANVKMYRGIRLFGQGRTNTIFMTYDIAKPAINCDQKLYCTIDDMDIVGTHLQSAPLVDANSARYLNMNRVRAYLLPDEHNQLHYNCIIVDISVKAPAVWNGYNRFNDCQFNYGSYNLYTTGGEQTVLYATNCTFSNAGYFGVYLDGVNLGKFVNSDIAGNGKLATPGNYNETMYGGVYINGTHIHFDVVWNEFNVAKDDGMLYNNIYATPNSYGIIYSGERNARTNVGIYQMFEAVGLNQEVATTDLASDSGLGKNRIRSLIKNGLFLTPDVNKPYGWMAYNADTVMAQLDCDLKGYEKKYQIQNTVTGRRGIYQTILDNTLDTEHSITNQIGKYISATAWVKNVSSINDPSLRVGLSFDETNVYMINGKYQPYFPKGKWVKIHVIHKITGDEPKIHFGAMCVGNGAIFEITGVNVVLSNRINDAEPKEITEYGGDISSQNFKIGGKRHGYASSVPSTGTWQRGDRVYNTLPVANGVEGWICIVAGTPGTWKTFGTIQS